MITIKKVLFHRLICQFASFQFENIKQKFTECKFQIIYSLPDVKTTMDRGNMISQHIIKTSF